MAKAVIGKQAVVIGAGMSGLAAAGALAGFFEHVVVLERDELPAGAADRQGTPQGRHNHALLAGGQRALGALYPGFEQDLAQAGAVPLRVTADFCTEMSGFDPFPQRDLGWHVYSMSRAADRADSASPCRTVAQRNAALALPGAHSRIVWRSEDCLGRRRALRGCPGQERDRAGGPRR
jgi:phytoene dehydrogenase-like protein